MKSSNNRWCLWLMSAVLMTSLVDCSSGSPEFVAEQCSEFDNIAFDGRYYRWTPYEKGGESCELLCKAEGLFIHQKLHSKVVDGTPCGKKPFSVCVNGHCMHTGCDGQLGSNMTIDNCGVCGGDGTSCSLIDHSGIFSKKTLLSGYNKVVTIPSGSVAVEIKDLGPTLNTLVLVDGSGLQMVLARDVKEAEYIFADTVFLYNSHEQQGQLHAVGPTAHSITVYMYNQGDWNPGISYNYKSIQNPQKSHHKNEKPSKGQKLQLHEQRSANKENEAESLESKGSNVLTLKDLDPREEIQNMQQNNLISTDSFKEDSNSNNDGLEYDSYNHIINNKAREPVHSAHAGSIWAKNAHGNLVKGQEDEVIQGLPEYFSSVRESSEQYMWSFGDWTGCSRKCGPGFQRRVISCIDRDQRKIVDPHLCRQRDKPISMQSCYNRGCSVNHPHDTYVRWQTGEWGPCSSSCDLGEQVQEVVCQAVTEEGSTAVVRDDQCYKEYGTKPVYVRSCNEDFPCPKWSFTLWSECSVTCGRGEQKRYVFCQQETAIESGIQKTIADKFCDISLKPVEYRLCSSRHCPKQHHEDRIRPTGIQQSCVNSYYGCCPDGVTSARGPRREGCPSQENIVISEDDAKNKPKCLDLEFGCCWDQVTPASGPNSEGCPPRYSKSQASCNSHPDVGSCRNFTVKWFYNTNTTQCDRFWYGGCDGNGNRFSDEKECLDVCKNDKTVKKDICDLPAVVGPCRAAHIRWHYEAKEKKCKNFTYGGCDGNDNRFRTKAECERRCSSAVLALENDREPVSTLLCEKSRHGCCQDGVTPATGPNSQGCPKDCQNTKYGCCDDGITAAQGEDGKGCEVVAGSGDVDTFCEESVFGCCPDGTTPAQGENNLGCEDVVSPIDSDSGFYIEPATTGACELPKDTGPCRHDLKVMWYYNITTGLCDRFWYGGCEGNSNRFKSEKECLATCINVDDRATRGTVLKIPRCEQEKKTGNCRAYIVRWFHNTTSGHCEQFIYGGCEGNDNNFETLEACEENCNVVMIGSVESSRNLPVCEQPKQEGMCQAYFPRWFYNRTSDRCEQFIYGGCQGNDNNFDTKEACVSRCPSRTSSNVILPESGSVESSRNLPVCEQPKQEGMCQAYFPRWFYNRTSDRCEQFIYGGCQGNDNNFDTKEACVSRCPSRTSSTVILPESGSVESSRNLPVCEQPKEEGMCKAYFPRWFYNRKSDRCEQFIYGGCQGNDNSFDTKEACAARCPSRTSSNVILPVSGPVCEQPNQPGPCYAYFPRWFYNRTSDRCEQFIYGGCQGNDNNFETKEACGRRCPSRARTDLGLPVAGSVESSRNLPVCEQPKQQGMCQAYFPRWFYNRTSDRCEQFIYGGCQGNDNNFDTKEACAARCPSRTSSNVILPESGSVESSRNLPVCEQPKQQGMCLAYFPRWFYNRTSDRCEQFIYGGCQGNDNNFDTKEACVARCPSRTSSNVILPVSGGFTPVCQLEPDMGPCRRAETKWHYDVATFSCKTFTYGGCLGNHNNFQTKEKCEEYCNMQPGRSVRETCLSSREPGSCTAQFRRWYYSSETGRCSEFMYGGCQGNGNNFLNEESCMNYCQGIRLDGWTDNREVTHPPKAAPQPEDICRLPLKIPCNDNTGLQYWYYDYNEGVCREVLEGQCNDNQNNFESKERCEAHCSRENVCRPFTQGVITCAAAIPRWLYNRETNKCEEFIYGGCGGTSNNFASREACRRKCLAQFEQPVDNQPVVNPTTAEEICALSLEVGNALSGQQHWYYDKLTGQCKEFTGSSENRNNFASKEWCEGYCTREVVCQEFVEPEISCYAHIPRWRYNPRIGRCEYFVYGGCGGNTNNFEQEEDCTRKCVHQKTPVREPSSEVGVSHYNSWQDICKLQADVGPCTNYVRKWHYNALTRECEEFTYGGCLGNHNNFESKEQCKMYCDQSRVRESQVGSGSIQGVEACHLDVDAGTCDSRLQMWHYDYPSGVCKQFVYKGCDGNDNRFDSKEECEGICNAAEICRQPMVFGRCKANFPRYYFDMRTGECKEFGYGGCDGNANNFANKEACQRKCGYLADQRPRPVITKTGYCPSLPNNVGGICVEACRNDGDCPGDQKCCSNGCGHTCMTSVEANVKKTAEGNENLACSKPSMQGDCNGNEIMWYYDPMIKDCRRFIYTGCGGNGNRFNTREECRNMCQGTSGVAWQPVSTDSTPQKYISTSTTKTEINVIVSDVCHTEERRELCTKYEVKWFFDRTIQRCNRFWYGGCEGRGNKFDTEEECQDICVNRKHGGQVTPIPTPHPSTRTPEPECRRSQYGCCKDGRTPAKDRYYSNCPETLSDCRLSRFGCCPDGVTAVVDRHYSNCRVNRTDTQTERDDEVTEVLVQPGKRAIMSCNRENYDASIAWYREGLLITPDNNFFIYPNGTLVIQFISSGDAGSYSCRITHGNVLPTIRRFKVIVQEPIRILPTPDTIIVKPGQTAFLHCQAQGSPQPRISWTKGNEPIRSGGRFDVFENGTLLIARTQPEDIDFYVCRAENGISIAVQRTVRLLLKEMLMAKIVSHQNQVIEGGRISLHCSGSGFPTPTVQWEKTGRPVTTGGKVYVSDGRLVIRDVTPEDTGVYTCIVANSEEKIESSTTIQVMPKGIQADACKDIAGEGKCRLIVYAGLCSYKMYSTICCNSCQNIKLA